MDLWMTGAASEQARSERGSPHRSPSADPFLEAVRTTRMPIVITNPRLPDNPAIFVNDAFCRMTGYERDEMLGRNCRFLQGPETAPDAVARVRAAVTAKTAIEIDVHNHRKGGEGFWNRLLISPVWGHDGELAYFIASQVDAAVERDHLAGLQRDNAALMAKLAARLRKQQENEARLRFAAEAGRLGIWELDLRSYKLLVSPVFRENFHQDPLAPANYRALLKAILAEDRHHLSAALGRTLADGRDFEIECRVLSANRSINWVHLRAQLTRTRDGAPLRLAGISLDVTARKAAELRRRALAELADRLRDLDDPGEIAFHTACILGSTFEVSRAGYGTVDLAAEIVTIERDWTARDLGSLAGIWRFRSCAFFIDALKRGEAAVVADVARDWRAADETPDMNAISGGAFLAIPVVEQGDVAGLLYLHDAMPREWTTEEVSFMREVAERTRMALRTLILRRRSEADMRHLAHHDTLTGLPNRLLLAERLDHAIGPRREMDDGLAVLYVDLDRFKAVNDLFGHSVGDKLLVAVVERLVAMLRGSDTLARIGSDEFAIVLPRCGRPQAMALAARIVTMMESPFDVGGQQLEVGASIGIACCPADGLSGETLLRCADIAMYRAKAERVAYRVFEPTMDAQLRRRRLLEHDLRRAIEREELELHYQPVANCQTGAVEAFEALVRWNHPTHGRIPPADFIPVAEETGLILAIGQWVLETACREAARWERPLRVAVNVSPVQFRQRNLPDQVRATLSATGLPAARLELEVTEGVLIDNPDRAMTILSALKAQGIRISLDDFGTGYSSLSYLQRFPFDTLKIDRQFITGLGQETQANAIVAVVGLLGHSLNLSVIAEGVETEAQLAMLRAQNCDYVQGYLISRPVPGEEARRLIAAGS